MDKRERALIFRDRLHRAMVDQGVSQARLARLVGSDRSTISQLLAAENVRLPNSQLVGECAQALGISSDWLLGLTARRERAADLVAAAMSMTEAPRALIDERIFAWHREAAGYKIRHVPAALPDMLKLPEVMQWEYEPSLGRTTEQAIGASADRLAWMQQSQSDYEIAMPLHELATFARAEGYYEGLPAEARRAQIRHLMALHAQLYPALRVYLFDARRLYSSPVTIFGPLLAVLYLGRNYLTFRDTERVRAISTHFDALVREASVSARDLPTHLAALDAEIT
ncbi:helix-turn-helix domain-containing protein [Pseudoroseicyclus tamaricis]|uniref:Helix-turn-helix domain-containing protein n=1 Tax=Pseudoroseicyclus tamaricis TaxID=2705421 RepID=A0A6B2JQL6_9RHOB|nr:helix-turn-helix domain-containing protein [Pseudoroseicyclus tamaricis]NDV00428.1 helix-turn-helix domain-containing protein [Pseudoroseicyclus tamaricis]